MKWKQRAGTYFLPTLCIFFMLWRDMPDFSAEPGETLWLLGARQKPRFPPFPLECFLTADKTDTSSYPISTPVPGNLVQMRAEPSSPDFVNAPPKLNWVIRRFDWVPFITVCSVFVTFIADKVINLVCGVFIFAVHAISRVTIYCCVVYAYIYHFR